MTVRVQTFTLDVFCFKERSKYVRLIFLAYTDAVINNGDFYFISGQIDLFVFTFNRYDSSVSRKLDRVRNQVEQNLSRAHWVDLQLQVTT